MNDFNLSNKEQAQLVKDWWQKYGSTILMAIIVFLAVNIGMKYWRQYIDKQNTLASIAYSQMLEAQTQNKNDEAKLFAERLIKDFSSSSYADFAAMIMAKYAIDANDFVTAKKHLAWVMQHAKQDELRELARLRQARILLAENKPKAALDLLQQNKDSASVVYPTAKYETIGDAWLALGQPKNAVTNYRKALNDNVKKDAENSAKPVSPISPLLHLKAKQLS